MPATGKDFTPGAKELSDCRNILGKIHRNDLTTLAFGLNNVKEAHCPGLFKVLSEKTCFQVVKILENAYMDKSRYNLKSLFPSIALKKVLQTMPQDQCLCNICKKYFEQYQDMIPKGCGKHLFHKDCLTKELNNGESPFHVLCECFCRANWTNCFPF